MKKLVLLALCLMLAGQPAFAATKYHKVFHYGVVWPLRVVCYVVAGPVMIPLVVAERIDKELVMEEPQK